jgi:hypothetical protein
MIANEFKEFKESRRVAVRELLVQTAAALPATRRRRARIRVAALAVVLLLGGGLSIAAAAGVPLGKVFGWTPGPGEYNPIPGTARVVLTTTDADGQPMRLWYTSADSDGFCVFDVIGLDVSPTDANADVLASTCDGPVGGAEWNAFGGKYAGFGAAGVNSFIMHAPGATRVVLQFNDGTTEALALGDAWTTGWFTDEQGALCPALVGYDAQGGQVGRVPLAPIMGPRNRWGCGG